MSATRNTKKRFATLYVNSAFAGDWAKCGEIANWPEADPQDSELRELIASEGGTVPETFELGESHLGNGEGAEFAAMSSVPTVPNEALKVMGDVVLPVPGAPLEEWARVWETLGPIYTDIALGKVEATQAQRMTLQKIFDKVYGSKEVEREEEAQPIVFLPMRGDLSGAYIEQYKSLTCPSCGEQITFDREEE